MKIQQLQIMVHDSGIGNAKEVKINYPGVSLKKVQKSDNANYLFLNIIINKTAKPGKLTVSYNSNSKNKSFSYELKERRKGNGVDYAKGVTSSDFIYLIMPDRFSNGDPSNDRIPGMRDQSLRRDTVFNRHGGDLKGIENHLDYLTDLGVTTLWLNPIWENNMPDRTEHGYAFTDHYRTDPRLGGNDAYLSLINAAHAKGLKVIQDAVYNHVGSYHHTVLDPPCKDWLHQWPTYTNTSYKDQTLFDPHASKKDRKQMADGWFTPQMPDLNQSNQFVANFLIQHAIWSVEEFGIDGWRIDTYAYNDLNFMNRCNKALMDEYPQISLFGETWVHGVPNQSYFCENNYNIPYKSNLQGVTDFQTLWGITDAMTKPFGWTDGVNKLYTTLAQDFVYKNPMRNVVFLDNHDMARFYSVVNENLDKYCSAICWMLTTRGIPQMYYSSEFATTGTTSPNDGYVRLDFPGGWPGDAINKFEEKGRTDKDKRIFNTIRTLAQFRKKSSALQTGAMAQFLPTDGLYVYFRFDSKQTILIAMNTGNKDQIVKMENYSERTGNYKSCYNVLDQKTDELKDITLQPNETIILELKP